MGIKREMKRLIKSYGMDGWSKSESLFSGMIVAKGRVSIQENGMASTITTVYLDGQSVLTTYGIPWRSWFGRRIRKIVAHQVRSVIATTPKEQP